MNFALPWWTGRPHTCPGLRPPGSRTPAVLPQRQKGQAEGPDGGSPQHWELEGRGCGFSETGRQESA